MIEQSRYQSSIQGAVAAAYAQAGQMQATASDKPLVNVDFDRTAEALSGLEAGIADLIDRIQPVCQPGVAMEGVKLAGDNQIQAAPSEVRARIIGLRARIEALSSRIASLRYTIEI